MIQIYMDMDMNIERPAGQGINSTVASIDRPLTKSSSKGAMPCPAGGQRHPPQRPPRFPAQAGTWQEIYHQPMGL